MKYIIEIEHSIDGPRVSGNKIDTDKLTQENLQTKLLFDFVMQAAELFIDTKTMDMAQMQSYLQAISAKKTVN